MTDYRPTSEIVAEVRRSCAAFAEVVRAKLPTLDLHDVNLALHHLAETYNDRVLPDDVRAEAGATLALVMKRREEFGR
jgi:hypothetical protein